MPAARYAQIRTTEATPDGLVEPLGINQQFHIADVIADAAPDWSVELYADMPGSGTIIVMPDEADDELGPTYFVHREGGHLCLDQLHWDRYSSVGRYRDIDAVARALRDQLLALRGLPTTQQTLH